MKKIHFLIGNAYSGTGIYCGYLFILVGLISIVFSDPTMAVFFIPAGIFLSFSFKGVYIDVANKRYKKYVRHFGIPFGKWVSYGNYPYLSTLILGYRSSFASRANAQVTTSKGCFHEIYLLSENHLQRLIVARFKNAEDARDKQNELSELLKLKAVVFNPVASRKKR